MRNRLSVRYMFFDNFITANIGGGINSVQRGTDFADRQHSTGAQLDFDDRRERCSTNCACSTPRARRAVCPNALSGTGPAINITGVANFGGPIAGDADAGFGFTQNVFQINDNVTLMRGDHAYKFGIDIQTRRRTREPPPRRRSTRSRPSRPIRRRANGASAVRATPASRSISGCPISSTARNLYGFFVQDDWRLNADLKLLYGVRYDVYGVPDGDPNAPVETSREFPVVEEQLRAPRWCGVDASAKRAIP